MQECFEIYRGHLRLRRDRSPFCLLLLGFILRGAAFQIAYRLLKLFIFVDADAMVVDFRCPLHDHQPEPESTGQSDC